MAKRLYLINPSNPLVSIVKVDESRWNHYRVWKPLSLMVLAGLTPPEWEVSIIDENLGVPDYDTMPRPDLVGITAFTSQADRAYSVAEIYRDQGVPVVMGGIHATMCLDEALERVDSVVTGEAEGVWSHVLEDAAEGCLDRLYDGALAEADNLQSARHDLLTEGYAFGSIQTTRGCPLNCSFCSVTSFNGTRYRQRPIPAVIQEFRQIRERLVLVVDDNLIGTRAEHIDHAKDLFGAMIHADLKKEWIAQVTINFADDDELLGLAAKAGCRGVFIGFESHTAEGLLEIGKKFNLKNDRNLHASVKRIQRHGILVAGAYILGLDVHRAGIGEHIAEAADHLGVDFLNALFLTPLPGTRLWDQMTADGNVPLNRYPDDWKYYTLTFPVIEHPHLSQDDLMQEMLACNRSFYSLPRILRRIWRCVWQRRQPLIGLVGNFSYKNNFRLSRESYPDIARQCDTRSETPVRATGTLPS